MPPEQMPPAAAGVRDVKISQTDAAYGPAYQAGQSCGNCVHFDGQGSCEIVDGPIDPTMVSDFFEPVQPSPTGGAPVQMGFEG